MKYLENVPDDKAHEVELMTGDVLMYEIDDSGTVLKKEVLAANDKKV
jgi:bisphosphoglycerate-dependent phosphoglycerate mutase